MSCIGDESLLFFVTLGHGTDDPAGGKKYEDPYADQAEERYENTDIPKVPEVLKSDAAVTENDHMAVILIRLTDEIPVVPDKAGRALPV